MLNTMVAFVLMVCISASAWEQPNFNGGGITNAQNQIPLNRIRNDNSNHDWLNVEASQSSAEEESLKRARSLVRAINQYRREQGLEEIPYSSWLTYVARYHVYDLETNNPTEGSCNLHSWSNSGSWSPCCYTSDHAQADCMWNKPRELSNGAYKGTGYEIAAWNSGSMTTYGALEQWEGSEGHLEVIINRGIWANKKWKAIGAAVSSHYAVVWFGD